jgi:hypothetical protein
MSEIQAWVAAEKKTLEKDSEVGHEPVDSAVKERESGHTCHTLADICMLCTAFLPSSILICYE